MGLGVRCLSCCAGKQLSAQHNETVVRQFISRMVGPNYKWYKWLFSQHVQQAFQLPQVVHVTNATDEQVDMGLNMGNAHMHTHAHAHTHKQVV